MERGLQTHAKKGVQEGRGTDIEGSQTVHKLFTQPITKYVSKLSIFQQQESLDGSEMSLDGTSGEKMIQQGLVHKIRPVNRDKIVCTCIVAINSWPHTMMA